MKSETRLVRYDDDGPLSIMYIAPLAPQNEMTVGMFFPSFHHFSRLANSELLQSN
jgi:hypothetical protein